MLQWLKRSLASFLGDKKDVVKNFPLIKKLNEKANIELDSKRSNLLKENFEEILKPDNGEGTNESQGDEKKEG